MLRPRPAAGNPRRHDVLVRMHLLPGLRRTGPEGPLPELRRRAGAPPDPSRGQTGEISGFHGTQGEAARVRGGVILTPLIPANAGRLLRQPAALDSRLRGCEFFGF